MKFEEKRKDIMTFPKCEKNLIYFLLKDNEVIYVGKTSTGLTRPYSHFDKDYDTVKVLPCDPERLNATEDFYINKYKPRYNKMNGTSVVRAVKSAKKYLNGKNYSNVEKEQIYQDALLTLRITPFLNPVSNTECVTADEFTKLANYLREKV